jgi:hypothetical protein
VAIDDTGEWWVGSEPSDIPTYLAAYTSSEGGYPAEVYRQVKCPCGSEAFRLERAADVARRTCAACGRRSYICREADDWEEAEAEEGAESYACVSCESPEVNIAVGFAGYDGDTGLDAVQWYHVGVRCARCGILGCFSDGKVGRGPAAEVYESA